MRTVVSEHCHGGLKVKRAIYSWNAGEALLESDSILTLKCAETRRQVRARLFDTVNYGERLGRFVLTPPDTIIPVRALEREDHFPVAILELDSHWLGKLTDEIIPFDFSRVTPQPDFYHGDLARIIMRILRELTQPEFASKSALDAMLTLFAVDLARALKSVDQTVACETGGLSDEQMALLRKVVCELPFNKLSSERIAYECGMSHSQLRRKFKASTGRTLGAHLQDVRMQAACALLADRDLPLKVISHRLGFSFPSAFCHAFRSWMGETPSHFRRNNC